mgnify:CR=1 FL=1
MSVRSIEAEVSIKSGVQAECTIGREVIVEVHEDVNLESLTVTANGNYTPTEGVDGFSDVTVQVPERIPVTESLSVTENGTYEPTEGIDGYDRVSVAVPERVPVTESLTATTNGVYEPDSGVDGYDHVTVAVPERQPDIESLTVTTNGTYTSTKDGYNPVTVAVPERVPDIEPLTVTENGTYTASGDGYNPVTVNVQGYKIHTVTVEIGENTVSNALDLYNYFLPYFEGAVALLGIVMQENAYTVNNQFVSYRYGTNTGYEHRTIRRRNNADNSFTWRANNYDTYLVAGTHYTVTFVR